MAVPRCCKVRRCWASHETASTSRWLVGSSSTSRSWLPSMSATRAARRRSPPERFAVCASRSMSASICSTIGRASGSDAHTWSGSPSRTRSRTLWPGTIRSAWASTPMDVDLVCVTFPSSGRMLPVSSPSRVDLPSPLRPTTPMTSPCASPRERSSRTIRVPYALPRCSALTMFEAATGSAATHRGAGTLHRGRHRPLGHGDSWPHGVQSLEA